MDNIEKIVIEYENGEKKEIEQGMAAELCDGKMNLDMTNMSKIDFIRIAYGIIVAVEEMGMMPALKAYAKGEID